MKQYCYVIVNNAGHSWAALGPSNAESEREQSAPVLPALLQDGWVPLRETPMGGGTSHLAHSLILMEKEAKAQANGRKRAKR